MVEKGIRWKFNPPAAPHHGGSWERLVRSFERVFYAVVGSRRLTDEILSTTFCLVEQVLNARPLSPASADPNDLTALTPNHFLLGRSVASPSGIPLTDNDFNHRKRDVTAQSYANAERSRWLKEYVPGLQMRTKWNSSAPQKLNSGDLVWVVESTSPRGFYPMARIVSLRYGADGFARSAELRTASGSLVRPVFKLVPVLASISSGGDGSRLNILIKNCEMLQISMLSLIVIQVSNIISLQLLSTSLIDKKILLGFFLGIFLRNDKKILLGILLTILLRNDKKNLDRILIKNLIKK